MSGIYTSKRWRDLRLKVLSEEPACRLCAAAGRVRAATVVDHETAHRQDPVLMWKRSNLRALCKPCHDSKTARVDNPKAFGRWQRIPKFVSKPPFPMRLVCGAPASGRADYIKSQMGSNDIVIDADVIASQLSGMPIYEADMKHWLVPTMLERNKRLANLKTARADQGWLKITGARLKDRREWSQMLGAEVIVIETDEEACIERIRHSRRNNKDGDKSAVRKWWKDYVSDPSDTVIRTH